MKLYLAHSFHERTKVREWELEFEARTGIELDNPFYDGGERDDIEKLDRGVKPDDWMTPGYWKRIVEHDLHHIEEADGLVAVIPERQTTIGTPMEIFYASVKLGKPVFVVAPFHSTHPWIRFYASRVFESLRAFENWILPRRIAFVGRMGDGKTSAAEYLVKEYGFTRYSFAAKVKELATDLFGMKEKDRVLLQKLGTDAIRRVFPNAWVDYLVRKIQTVNPAKATIDDCRFLNEAEALRAIGFTIVRVVKLGDRTAAGLSAETESHPSELEQAKIEADHTIEALNLTELYAGIDELLDYSPPVSNGGQLEIKLMAAAIGGNVAKGDKKDLKWLIKECEARLQEIIKKLSDSSSDKELRFYTDAFAKVVGTLAKLYEMQGEEVSKVDIVRILSGVETLESALAAEEEAEPHAMGFKMSRAPTTKAHYCKTCGSGPWSDNDYGNFIGSAPHKAGYPEHEVLHGTFVDGVFTGDDGVVYAKWSSDEVWRKFPIPKEPKAK